MDPITQQLLMGAAGSGGEKIYVEDVFSTWLYTGTGSTQTITNGIDLSGEGGLVWYKSRNNVVDNALFDTARGAGKLLISNTTDAEGAGYGQAFTSSGFSLTNGGTFYNGSGYTYASWTFRKAAKFFDVVTYTGNGGTQTISHNLGSAPGAIIIKATSAATNWIVYHQGIGATKFLQLNQTNAAGTYFDYWNNTAPTSTQFTLGAATATNDNGATYVAYLFAHDAGGFGDSGSDSVIKCGSFTTDGSGNATVSLGWEPQWVMIKRSDSTGAWLMFDNMRGLTLGDDRLLYANLSDAEGTVDWLDPAVTGFNAKSIATSATYIYIAIRRGPMKTPTDATKVFSASLRTGTGSVTNVTSLSFPTDLLLPKARSQAWYALDFYDRLRGSSLRLDPSAQSAEGTPTAYPSAFLQNGYTLTADANGYVNFSGESYIDLNFRRAPGFFDIVAYTGTGVVRTVAHNLGVAPELMITKRRDFSSFWAVYYGLNTSRLLLNSTTSTAVDSAYWDNTSPTSTQFTVATNSAVNTNNGTYIAYLFATCPGVSKVGTYTGSGSNTMVDCGFTNGARFVLVKRTDSAGGWYVWDTARGIVAANDPYLQLNNTAAEVTFTDYIDPYSAGFTITSSAPADLNAAGGTFLFLAIA